MDGSELRRITADFDDGIDDPGPPVGQRGWGTGRAPSPPNGFSDVGGERQATDAQLLAVVAEHVHDGMGHCVACGRVWTCEARLRAAAELRRRGIERPILEGP